MRMKGVFESIQIRGPYSISARIPTSLTQYSAGGVPVVPEDPYLLKLLTFAHRMRILDRRALPSPDTL